MTIRSSIAAFAFATAALSLTPAFEGTLTLVDGNTINGCKGAPCPKFELTRI